ncbi:HmuY family protein [candidate division WOR-3 bacterium]|nr:HmuY family protein [candidate division WOR-3 bacterium]
MIKKTLIIAMFASLIFYFGCAKESPTESEDDLDAIEYMIDASSPDEWAYFSFSDGQTVSIPNPTSSLMWDLGFQRFRIQTNSGTSGTGQGGAINMGKIDFETLSEAPASGYEVDTILTYDDMSGTHEYNGNPAMKDWYNIAGMPPTFTAKDTVFVVKTADGKYAKVKILDYYDAQHSSGFITFKYVYQPDGSRDLE